MDSDGEGQFPGDGEQFPEKERRGKCQNNLCGSLLQGLPARPGTCRDSDSVGLSWGRRAESEIEQVPGGVLMQVARKSHLNSNLMGANIIDNDYTTMDKLISKK